MIQKKEYKQLEDYLYMECSSETAKTYIGIIQKFLMQYPNAKKMGLEIVESYLANYKKNGSSIGYRSVILSAIKMYYNFLEQTNQINHHPCKDFFVSEKKATGKNFGGFLTLEEMEQLLVLKEDRYKHTISRNKSIISLLIYQGLTSTELIEMKVSDIDLDAGRVNICRGANKSRILELKPRQVKFLLDYIDKDRKCLNPISTNKLFITMRGTPITSDSLHGLIQTMNFSTHKEVSPQNIRNSVINYWLNTRNIPLEDVQIMAGHRYPSSTEKYIRLDMDEQREALNKIHLEIFG